MRDDYQPFRFPDARQVEDKGHSTVAYVGVIGMYILLLLLLFGVFK
jgi:hypothetical protein